MKHWTSKEVAIKKYLIAITLLIAYILVISYSVAQAAPSDPFAGSSPSFDATPT